jgi:hypothetical protein
VIQRLLVSAAMAVALLASVGSLPNAASGAGDHAAVTLTAAPAGPAGPAPLGVTSLGTWWQQGAPIGNTGFEDTSTLWVFDPVGQATPYGWHKGYVPTGSGSAQFSQQFAFVYSQNGSQLQLAYPSGAQQTLDLVSYDATQDILTVNWTGVQQQWAGCRSGRMPPLALAACR